MVKPLPNQNRHTRREETPEKTHQFKGVRMRKWGKWVSEVRVPNSPRRIWLGSYNTAHQAARAYDCAVFCLKGSKAKFNFPQFLPEIPSASSLSPAEIQAVAARFAVEEFRQPSENCSALSGRESPSFMDSQCILEEQDPKLLDLLLQDLESYECPNLEDFPSLDVPLDDLDFPLFEKEQRGRFLRQTEE